ncbi:MAG: hypothetical protein GF383_04315 [Candidatus Lokiarchaeota archaeon]|nr:hypothetical protein [Candidatus Lokiarchaeota archaeon]MBD3338984.1 hypothetical protein [Candidatus Lokiarchaeota archaeon]
MTSKITFIVGSPRKNRSCDFLINQAIEGLKSVSEDFTVNKIYISDFNISPCTGCDQCLRKPYECPLSKEDDTKKLEDVILDSVAIFIASPTYFGSVSSQIKVLIDRSRPWKMAGYKLKNIILSPIVAVGLRNGPSGGVITDLVNFGLIQGMIIVGAVGNPVMEGNIAVSSLQKYGMKEFLGKDENDELAGQIAKNQGVRVGELLLKMKI